MVFYQFSSFLLYRNCKRLREYEEIEISSQSCLGKVNNKEENSSGFCLDFVQEFGFWVGEGVLVYVDSILTLS
jgi:hypothetical protein